MIPSYGWEFSDDVPPVERHIFPPAVFAEIAAATLKQINEDLRWPEYMAAQSIYAEIAERVKMGQDQNWRGFARGRLDDSNLSEFAALRIMSALYPTNHLGQMPRHPMPERFLLPEGDVATSVRIRVGEVPLSGACLLIRPETTSVMVCASSEWRNAVMANAPEVAIFLDVIERVRTRIGSAV